MAKCSYVLKTQVVFFSILLLRLAPVCSQPQLEVMLEEQSHCTPPCPYACSAEQMVVHQSSQQSQSGC